MDIPTAISNLGSRDKALFEPAEEALRNAGTEALEPLLDLWETEARRLRARRRISLPLTIVAGCVYVPLIAATKEDNWLRLIVSSVMFYAVLFCSTHLVSPTRALSRAEALLSGMSDHRALGPLTKRYGHPQKSSEIRKRRDLVTRLLLQIGPDNAGSVTQGVLAHMHYVLRHWEHFDIGPSHGTDYICAILSALEAVGDKRSIPYVQQVAEASEPAHGLGTSGLNATRRAYNATLGLLVSLDRSGYYRPVDRGKVIAAAEKCLTVLLARAESDQEAARLLRPVSTLAHEALLRPAGSVIQPAEGLLRASSTVSDRKTCD